MSHPSRDRGPVRNALFLAALVAAALAGLLVGVGAFTFDYAEGFSSLSSDPAAAPTATSCTRSTPPGSAAATAPWRCAWTAICPHTGLAKWIAKAENGYRHSVAFTLQNFHEPIVMTRSNRELLQENCLACHAELTYELGAGHADSVECVHCHRSVGHGERAAALGGPERAAELPLQGAHR